MDYLVYFERSLEIAPELSKEQAIHLTRNFLSFQLPRDVGFHKIAARLPGRCPYRETPDHLFRESYNCVPIYL